MSASKADTACEICDEKRLPNYFCIDCDSTFCAQCWPRQRSHAAGKLNRDGIPHEMLPDKEVIDRLKVIFTPANDPEQQRQLHKTDAGSKWFGVAPNAEGELILQDYGRYSSIMRESSTGYSKRWPQLVSFVGQTGAGKSTLVKALVNYQERNKTIREMDEFPSPVAGSATAHAPTSSDVHLYADPGTYHSRCPILYADCEGMEGGEKIPIGYRQTRPAAFLAKHKPGILTPHQPKAPDTETPRKTSMKKQSKGSKHVLAWATNPDKCKREFFVKNLYPRILYAFSDIVVFVLRNDRTFESGALVPLLQWADSSVETSVNQSAMPHVIIVLNFADPCIDLTGWTAKGATDSLLGAYTNAVSENPTVKEMARFWQDRGKAIKTTKDLLQCYYSSITVIRMPQKGRYGIVDTQIAELNLQIEQKCGEARENRKRFRISFNAEEFQAALHIGFDHFSNRLDEPLDFVQISCKSNPIPKDFGGNIVRLALAVQTDRKMGGKTGRVIFEHLGHMVASCIMLDYNRHEIKGTPSRLLLHYKESYSWALNTFCELFWPCSFVYKGERCINTKQGHIHGHQDANGRIMYDGPYESTDDFTEQAFEKEWHEMLERNLDDMRAQMSKIMRGEIAVEEQSLATDLHLQRISDFYSKLGDLSIYRNHAACFSCLREVPEHPLPCGHVLCTPCVKAFAQRKNRVTYAMKCCPLHPLDRWDKEWDILVKPDLAGVRLLTLDGGGVRGIVELRVLAEIQRNLGQMQIASFFDLIVGTSTGGIIAIGMGVQNWSIDDCTRKFEELCTKAFIPRLWPVAQQLKSFIFRKGKYKTAPLDGILTETFGEDRLFGGKCEEARYQRKVAVVSTYGTGSEAVILTNYNRAQRNSEPDYRFERATEWHSEMKIWEACRATSAAPTYFKPFRNTRTGHSYIDGAMYYNNPARVAHQERKLLWPDMESQPPDIVLSIGSSCTSRSKHDKDPKSTDTRVFKVALKRFDNMMDAQNAWEQFEQEVREPYEPQNGRYVRLNPEMKSRVKLDDVSKMRELRGRVEDCMKTPKWQTQTRIVAKRLIASSFFFEKDANSNSKDIIEGWICCRFPDESDELRFLGRYLRQLQSGQFHPFFVIVEEDEEAHGSLRMITKEVINAMIYDSTFEVDKLKIPLSSKLARTAISLCMSKDQELYSISGFPRSLGSDGLQNGRVRTADDLTANQLLSHATEKGITTQAREDQGKQSSINRSNLDLSNQRSSSSETLPLHIAEEDIPFWARASLRSRPNSKGDSKENLRSTTSDAKMISDICSRSPIDSASAIDRKQSQEAPLPGTPAEDLKSDEAPSDQRPKIGADQPKSDSRVHQSLFWSEQSHRDASPTPHMNARNKTKLRRLSLEEPRSYSTFESEVLAPMRTSTGLAPTGNLDIFNDQFPQQITVKERVELWSQKGLMMSHVPTREAPQPPNISIKTNVPLNPVSPSITTPRSFQGMPYTRRQEESSSPISPTIYYSESSHNMRKRAVTGSMDLPPVPFVSPDDVIDMTEEEAFEIARMRSMRFA